eukprot:Phypoly_transcript_15258.p1 GENE.Phypoly_transcript_15258~~Phypoly_transcript_15258.p1  ORF type:complete len:298 (+),score=52.88 Phypoly_transcript_15258:44-937(+)
MASPSQHLHNHTTGLQESEGEGDSKSILHKIIPKRFSKKQSSLKSLDGSDQLSRSPSPDSRQSSKAALGVRDSVVLLPHMYNTNSFERFAAGSWDKSAEDSNMSIPIKQTTSTPRRATIDSPRVSTPLSHIISSEDRMSSTTSMLSTPRRRSMPEVSPLLIVSEAPGAHHPPATPTYAFAPVPPIYNSRRKSTPNPIRLQDVEQIGGAGEGSERERERDRERERERERERGKGKGKGKRKRGRGREYAICPKTDHPHEIPPGCPKRDFQEQRKGRRGPQVPSKIPTPVAPEISLFWQ